MTEKRYHRTEVIRAWHGLEPRWRVRCRTCGYLGQPHANEDDAYWEAFAQRIDIRPRKTKP